MLRPSTVAAYPSRHCSSVSVASSAFAIPAGSSNSGYEAISTGQEAPENAHIARVPAIVKRVFSSLVKGAEWMAQEYKHLAQNYLSGSEVVLVAPNA